MKKPKNKLHIAALKWLLFICAILLLLLVPHSSMAKKMVKAKEKSIYVTRTEFISAIQRPGTHYIVFAGDWCPHCKELTRRMRNANIIDKVLILDTSKGFAFNIAAQVEIPGVPCVAVVRTSITPDGKLDVRFDKQLYFGTENCMLYLLTSINAPKPKVRSLQELGL